MTHDRDTLLESCAGLLDMLARAGLITLVATMETTKVDTALVTILSAMEQIRGQRATVVAELHRLNNALAGLERLAGQLTEASDGAIQSASDPVSPPPGRPPEPPTVEAANQGDADADAEDSETSTELSTEEDEPETDAEADTPPEETEGEVEVIPLEPVRSRRAARMQIAPNMLPVYYICERCFGYHNRGTSCATALSPDELDGRHGPHGWVGREQPQITSADIERAAMRLRIEKGRAAQAAAAQQEARIAKTDNGMRAGSKNSRIYEATKQLLEGKSPLHLDDILSGVQAKEPHIFDSVNDPRMNLSNILSLLKSRRLLASDHRGYWWMPNGRAAP